MSHFLQNCLDIDTTLSDLIKKEASRKYQKKVWCSRGKTHKVVMRATLRKLLGDEKINFFFLKKDWLYYCWSLHLGRWPRKKTLISFSPYARPSARLTRVILLLWSAYFLKKASLSFSFVDFQGEFERCCRLFHTWIEVQLEWKRL